MIASDDAPGIDRRVFVRRRQSLQRGREFHGRDPFDPKAVWLNAEHIRTLPVEELAARLLPFAQRRRTSTSIRPRCCESLR